MKKQILVLALSMIFGLNSFAQIVFENGYFIDDSDQRIECLIKNMDWKNNPTMFEYTLPQDAIVQKASIETVKEFGINGVSKFIRATVQIDKSGDDPGNMSIDRNPVFQEETLFLKVLVEGNATLFIYERGNLRRFFYKTKDSAINQLVYKRFLVDRNIAHNNLFRQQLFVDLKCQEIAQKDVENVSYTEKDLGTLFVDYNECTNSAYNTFISEQKKEFFNFSVRPGINFSSLEIKNPEIDPMVIDLGTKLSFRIGIEAEYMLPFNKSKWALIVEPTYQYFNSEKATEADNISGGILVTTVNYQSIEVPLGVRHYFFLNDRSKLFADISYIFDIGTYSVIQFSRNDGSVLSTLDYKSKRNFGLGIGYKYQDKYSVSMRYQTSREILGDYVYWNASYNTISLILGYTLF